MVVGEIPEAVDLLVVGGGPGGYVAAIRAAHAGRSVLLVERAGAAGLGGTCLRDACIPSKALLEVADVLQRGAELGNAGIHAEVSFDMAGWQSWREQLVSRLGRGISSLLASAGVTVLAGTLHFTRRRQAVIEVPEGTVRYVEFRDVIIATGARPRSLPHLPFDGVRVVDTAQILRRDSIPRSVVVVGAGRVGVELATTLAKLGSRVTLCERAASVLPTYDLEVSRPVQSRLRQLGVEVLVDSEVVGGGDGTVRVVRDGEEGVIEGDVVLAAVGRRPNTDDLGLDRLEARTDEDGYLVVAGNQLVREHVAAIGDCTAGHALAHRASAEAGVAVDALGGDEAVLPVEVIPDIVYGDPEVASAGLTLASARAEGVDVRTAKFPLSALGRAAMSAGASRGFARLVIRDDNSVVGVQLVGPHATELIGTAVVALEMGAVVADLLECVPPHPSLTEVFREAARLAAGSPIHVPMPR